MAADMEVVVGGGSTGALAADSEMGRYQSSGRGLGSRGWYQGFREQYGDYGSLWPYRKCARLDALNVALEQDFLVALRHSRC